MLPVLLTITSPADQPASAMIPATADPFDAVTLITPLFSSSTLLPVPEIA